jgi:hypothetical protein
MEWVRDEMLGRRYDELESYFQAGEKLKND